MIKESFSKVLSFLFGHSHQRSSLVNSNSCPKCGFAFTEYFPEGTDPQIICSLCGLRRPGSV